jgi:nicotinate-nucleotide--dimethylbenzimidazole phosphoribosyltransferase
MNTQSDLDQFRQLVKHLPIRRIENGHAAHPRLSLFAAARDEAEAREVGETLRTLAPDCDLARAAGESDADLRLYELDLAHPASALDEALVAETAAYGMTAIEPGPDLFCLAALCDAAGVLPAILSGLDRREEPLALLARRGGRDTVCLFGAIVAARMAALPVILDGAQALAAASIVQAINPHAVSHLHVPGGSPQEAVAARLGIAAIPYAEGGAFPLSLAYAVQAWRARRHGLA